MTLVDRFLKYVSFDTQSDESTGLTPSTPKQMVFAEYLKTELESLGLEDITLDEHGYLFATLPANIDKEVPTIGSIRMRKSVKVRISSMSGSLAANGRIRWMVVK